MHEEAYNGVSFFFCVHFYTLLVLLFYIFVGLIIKKAA